jgi:hypothetical protein
MNAAQYITFFSSPKSGFLKLPFPAPDHSTTDPHNLSEANDY